MTFLAYLQYEVWPTKTSIFPTDWGSLKMNSLIWKTYCVCSYFFLIWSERCLLFYDPGWFNQVVQNLFIDLKRLEGFSLLIKSPIDIVFIHDFLTTLLFLLLLEALKSWRFIKRQHISWYSSTRNMVKYYLVYPCKSTGYYTENVVMDFSPILKWADVFCTCSAS